MQFRQSQLAGQWHACYAELDALARGDCDDWNGVAGPIISKIRRIEGEIVQLQWTAKLQRAQKWSSGTADSAFSVDGRVKASTN